LANFEKIRAKIAKLQARRRFLIFQAKPAKIAQLDKASNEENFK